MTKVTKLPPDLEPLRRRTAPGLCQLPAPAGRRPRREARTHQGRGSPEASWDTFEDAYQAGTERFELGEGFLHNLSRPSS